MLRFNVAVCDDERFAADAITDAAQAAFSRVGAHAEVETFTSTDALARRLGTAGFDLIFLDIEMPGMDGIRFGQALRDLGVGTDIMFVSNSDDRVFESLSVRPAAFVRKSHFNEDMAVAVARFVKSRRKASTSRVVTMKIGHAMATYQVDDIRYVEAKGRDKIVHLVGGRTERVTTTLDELTEKLEPFGFCRCHKGFLVNFAHVTQIGPDGFAMGEETIPIGRSRAFDVKVAYLDYLQDKNVSML